MRVLRDTLAVSVHEREITLADRIVLLRSGSIPLHGFRVVSWDTKPGFVQSTEVVLCRSEVPVAPLCDKAAPQRCSPFEHPCHVRRAARGYSELDRSPAPLR